MRSNRRRFLQAAGGVFSTLSLPMLTACGSDGDALASPTRSRRTLHFDLAGNGFLDHREDFRLHAAGRRYALVAHDADSLRTAGADAQGATHFASDVLLPDRRAVHVYVTQRSDRGGLIRRAHGAAADHGLALSAIHIPPAARATAAAAMAARRKSRRTRKDQTPDAGTIASFATMGPQDIATTILFHHANLMALDADTAAIVMAHLLAAEGLGDLERAIRAKGPHGWYDMVAVLGDDDQPAMRADGTPLVQYVVDPDVMLAGQGALASGLNAVHNDPLLKDLLYASTVGDADADGDGAPQGTGAAVAKARTKDTASSQGLTYRLAHDGRQTGLSTSLDAVDGTQVTLGFASRFIRHLSVFVEFMDVDGKVIDVTNWLVDTDEMASIATRQQSASLKFLTLMSPPTLFLSGPLLESSRQATFYFPPTASSARVMAGGLGNGGHRRSDVEEIGIALTSTFEIGLPSILLASAAGYHDDGDTLKKIFRASILGAVVNLFFSMIWSKGDRSAAGIMAKAATFMANIMMKSAMQEVLSLIIEDETESAVEDAIPFVGWALNAVSIATTAAQLAQTIAEVASSPYVIENILTVTHDVVVTVAHDPDDYQFPATATHYTVELAFSHAKTVRQTIALPGTTVSAPQQVVFAGVPYGGTVSATVTFHSASGWIAGFGTRPGIANLNDAGKTSLSIDLVIEERLVPLTTDTRYAHKQKLTADGNAFAWQAAGAPAAVRDDLNAQPRAGALANLFGVSVNQTLGRLSYSWQSFSGSLAACGGTATGQVGYAYRTIGLGQDPNVGGKFPGCYDTAPTLVQTALTTSPQGVGDNLLVQPAGDGTWVVKRFALDAAGTYVSSGVLGVFPIRPDVVRSLPGDVLVGISRAHQKLLHLRLMTDAAQSEQVPEATLASGPAFSPEGRDDNPALLLAPVTMDVAPNDTLIVLEVDPSQPGAAGTLRAFNPHGQPVAQFAGGTLHAVPLRAGSAITYLDMSIEHLGFIYVLSFVGDGHLAQDYVMDIYDPQGAFLASTPGVVAANFALDAWRNVYTLNYEAITAPAGDTEPSVSEWIPSTPSVTTKRLAGARGAA
ncbi:MAG TPA: hypothetical protein PK072_03385 [Quisquiliibacterium sp.]|nr:hypothetical protein [Quisquiliibacterium sp.]